MFFPKSVGLSIHENDLILSKISQKFVKCAFESIVIKDFLLKDSLDIKLILNTQGYQAKETVLSWPREKTIVREVELPGSNIKALRDTISYQLDCFVLFSEDSIYYDIYPSTSSEYGEKAFIFAIKKEDLDSVISRFESLNINPNRVVISPLSFIPFVNEGKVIVIDKRADFYTFNLYTDSVLVNTSLIRKEDVLKEKIVESKPNKVILLSKECNDIVDYGKENIEVELWEDSKESLGAAVNGASEYLKGFNVLKISKKKFIPQSILAGALLLSIIAFAFFMPGIVKHKKEQTINIINNKLQELQPEVTAVSELKGEIAGLIETTNKVKELISYDNRRIDLLAELTGVIPDDTWVKQLSFKKDYFEMEGIGASGANVLTLLEYSPIFSQVRFTSSVSKNRDGKERFKIRGNTK